MSLLFVDEFAARFVSLRREVALDMSSVSDDTTDDELVCEMDVFITRRLQSNLHILQFPIGFSPFSTNEECLRTVRVKPKNKKFEVEVALNTASKNFDRGKGEQIAYVANSSQEDDKPLFPNNVMNKQILKSIEVKPSLPQYSLGIISDGNKELHLTPVSSVIQFRPSFHYFDKSEIRVNTKGPVVKEEPAVVSEDETEAKRINVRFAGLDEEKAKKAREMTYAYLQQQIESEPWVDLEFHDSEDIVSQNERRLLLYNANDDNEQDNEGAERTSPIMSIDEYLKSLVFTDTPTKPTTTANATPKCTSITPMKSLALPEQIRTLIVNAKAVSFNELKEYLFNNADENAILRYLQQYAMLIQGNWVVKSEILYPKDGGLTISPVSGVPIEVLCRARDYVMWLFTQSTSVNRKEVMNATKASQEDVLLILKQMAVYNKLSKQWDFILPIDNDFMKRYSDVVTRQKMLWEVRYSQLDRNTKARRDISNCDDGKFSSPTNAPRKRRRSRRDSSASGTDVSESEIKETEKKKAPTKRKSYSKKKQ